MRQAARSQKAVTTSVPAPVGGLNAVNAYAEMSPTDAVVMDNWVPGVSDCAIRPGYTSQVTGFASQVQTLMPYNSATVQKLFAAAGTSIYDVTTPGGLGAAKVTGLTNAKWQYVNVGTIGGQFLLAVNAADKMRVFDGTTWGYEGDGTFPAVTGFNTALAKDIQVYSNRVWFVEKNSFRVWYLPLNSIGGAATSIDLSSLYILGGSLQGMVTWQVQSVLETYVYVGFISSQGEVLLYSGTDPSNAATWQRLGQFRIGHPIGQRFYERAGNDTLLITTDGIIPMSKAGITDRQTQSDAISYKIIQLVNTDIGLYGSNFGWQVILYPAGNRIIINVPKSQSSDNVQYVMNTITNSWCRYTGIAATCWALFQDNIYFGGDTAVYRAEYGNDDNGNAIAATVTPAYSYFKSPGRQKLFTGVRPIVTANGTFVPSISLTVDFQGPGMSTTAPQLSNARNPAVWNTSAWNVTPWGSAFLTNRNWQWIGGIGFAATLTMRSSTKGMQVNWASTDWIYEPGGVL